MGLVLILRRLTLAACLAPSAHSYECIAPTNDSVDSSFSYNADQGTYLANISDEFGTREVAYWITDDGLAVVEGDIVYGTVEDLLKCQVSNATIQTKETAAIVPRAFLEPSSAWPNANIIYKYNSDATERKLTAQVIAAIVEWKTVATYLRFNRRPNSDDDGDGVLTMTSVGSTCHSSVGT